MGMGEPLDNFDAVAQAIRVLGEPNGINFPQAQITVSTVGRIDGLRRLAALELAEPAHRDFAQRADRRAAPHAHAGEPGHAAGRAARARSMHTRWPARGGSCIEYVLLRGRQRLARARRARSPSGAAACAASST